MTTIHSNTHNHERSEHTYTKCGSTATLPSATDRSTATTAFRFVVKGSRVGWFPTDIDIDQGSSAAEVSVEVLDGDRTEEPSTQTPAQRAKRRRSNLGKALNWVEPSAWEWSLCLSFDRDKAYDVNDIERCLDIFRKWCRSFQRTHPGTWFVWKMEPQHDGTPHFHILGGGVSLVEIDGSVQRSWLKFIRSKNSELAHVQPFHSGCLGYLTAPSKLAGDIAIVERLGRTRSWGVVNRKAVPMAQATVVDVDAERMAQVMEYLVGVVEAQALYREGSVNTQFIERLLTKQSGAFNFMTPVQVEELRFILTGDLKGQPVVLDCPWMQLPGVTERESVSAWSHEPDRVDAHEFCFER